MDIVVANPAGTWFANLQVKTSRSRVAFWPLGAQPPPLQDKGEIPFVASGDDLKL
jgi:hypothetical protein